MPNWCNNSLLVSHPDKEMMAKFAAGVKNGNLFDTFIPMPQEMRDTTSPSIEINEALIEKFFDMSKPSSGFRMTQPQIDMALHARSLLQGLGVVLVNSSEG